MNTDNGQPTIPNAIISVFLENLNKAIQNGTVDTHKKTTGIPFFDSEYSQIPNVLDIVFSKQLTPADAATILGQLLDNKAERIEEIKRFLFRHKIDINLPKNDYSSFDSFCKENVDFNDRLELQDWVVSDFWLSVLIDMALLIGDYFVEKYPFLNWYSQNKHPRAIGYNKLVIVYFLFPNGKKGEMDIISLLFHYGANFIYPESRQTQGSFTLLDRISHYFKMADSLNGEDYLQILRDAKKTY